MFQPSRLEAAVARPQQSAGYEDAYPTLPEKAAALTHGLIMNHPFLDANKRTGILSGVVFMELNGREVRAERDALYATAVGVENKTILLPDLTGWYDNNTWPLTESEMEEIEEIELRRRYDAYFDD